MFRVNYGVKERFTFYFKKRGDSCFFSDYVYTVLLSLHETSYTQFTGLLSRWNEVADAV